MNDKFNDMEQLAKGFQHLDCYEKEPNESRSQDQSHGVHEDVAEPIIFNDSK